jgi:hypothetical protein
MIKEEFARQVDEALDMLNQRLNAPGAAERLHQVIDANGKPQVPPVAGEVVPAGNFATLNNMSR